MNTPKHNTNVNHSSSWKKNTNDDLHAIWHKLNKLNVSGGGGGCCPETNELLEDLINAVTPTLYNQETEILLPIGSPGTHTIPANSVHAYSIIVEDGTGTGSTIQIGANPPLSIYKGYLKTVEFTTTNISQVIISSDTLDRIRIIKIN